MDEDSIEETLWVELVEVNTVLPPSVKPPVT